MFICTRVRKLPLILHKNQLKMDQSFIVVPEVFLTALEENTSKTFKIQV